MLSKLFFPPSALIAAAFLLTSCGGIPFWSSGDESDEIVEAEAETETEAVAAQPAVGQARAVRASAGTTEEDTRETIWDLFDDRDDPNVTIEVNKYIWAASLDVLSFLPVASIDPFSGVIETGWGAPPGGSKSYQATIRVQDPALDARSIKLALRDRSGTVDPDTVRRIEDAILTRARQLRVEDANL